MEKLKADLLKKEEEEKKKKAEIIKQKKEKIPTLIKFRTYELKMKSIHINLIDVMAAWSKTQLSQESEIFSFETSKNVQLLESKIVKNIILCPMRLYDELV
jgi:hypothetical protein